MFILIFDFFFILEMSGNTNLMNFYIKKTHLNSYFI